MKQPSFCKTKSFFTLIEVIVSFSLLFLLTGVLLMGFVTMARNNRQIEKVQKHVFTLDRIHRKIKSALKQAYFPKRDKQPHIWVQERAIDRDPAFAGSVEYQLKVTAERLVLSMHSLKKDKKVREEELLDGVQQFSCEWKELTIGHWIWKVVFFWNGQKIEWSFIDSHTLANGA